MTGNTELKNRLDSAMEAYWDAAYQQGVEGRNHDDMNGSAQAAETNLRDLFACRSETLCPRPCNHRPDVFSQADCVVAGECGCGANHPLPQPHVRALPKLTKPQAALYERVKAGGLPVRHLSAAENRVAHRLKDMGLLALDGSISSRGPYNQAAQNDQVWVLYEDMHPEQTPAPVSIVMGIEPTHRHKKRGSTYALIGIGKMQAEDWYDGDPDGDGLNTVDMREVAVYRSIDDGSLWVRPREEFEDGRFEALSAPEADHG